MAEKLKHTLVSCDIMHKHAYYTGSERAPDPNYELYTALLAPAPTIRFGSYRIPSIIRGKQKTVLPRVAKLKSDCFFSNELSKSANLT